MKIGRLKQKVSVQHKVAGSPDRTDEGDEDKSWTAFLTDISAEWQPLSGSALFAAQQHHSEVRGIWRIRWRSTITDQMRIVHNGLYYNILWVPPLDRKGFKHEMELECAEGVNLGGEI